MVLTNICLSFFTTDSAKSLYFQSVILSSPEKISPYPMKKQIGAIKKNAVVCIYLIN